MHKFKLVPIFLAILLLGSCSVFRRSETEKRSDATIRTDRFLSNVGSNNLTNKGFRFDRIKVVMEAGGETRRFSANIRYDSNETMLISVRIIASIEVARIYVDRNKIIVLDRLNRVYSTGESAVVLKKYGLDWDLLPLLFGDLPKEVVSEQRIRCSGGVTTITLGLGNDSYSAGFDCNQEKLISINGSSEKFSVSMTFKDFSTDGGAVYPENIWFREEKSVIAMNLSLSGYSGYNGINEAPQKPSRYDNGKLE